jgi:hypothetical protein
MINITDSTTKGKQTDALRKARTEAIFNHIISKGSVSLSDRFYQLCSEQGFTRKQVDLAINDLLEQNRISLKHSSLWLTVAPMGEVKSEVVAL